MTCLLHQYYPKAFEEVTIQDLYQYCQDHPQDLVYYLHNKGSYTLSNRKNNERWRIQLTDFLFRHGRTYLLDRHAECNTVGSSWEPFNYWHFPGNFWMAKCSYVRHLLPPKDYEIAHSRMIMGLLLGDNQTPQSPQYCLASYVRLLFEKHRGWTNLLLGLQRFIYEKWICSHPHVVPCDSRDTIFNTTLLNLSTSWIKSEYGRMFQTYQYEWKRMHGQLYEFHHLYGQIPNVTTSFFYTYYNGTQTPTLPMECRKGQGRNLSTYC
jgi:hypothetical protein